MKGRQKVFYGIDDIFGKEVLLGNKRYSKAIILGKWPSMEKKGILWNKRPSLRVLWIGGLHEGFRKTGGFHISLYLMEGLQKVFYRTSLWEKRHSGEVEFFKSDYIG